MENNQYPKGLMSAADILKNHRHDNSVMRKQSSRYLNTKKSRNKTRVDRSKRKQQKKNHKQVLYRKVNLNQSHTIAVESLDIFFRTVPKNRLLQKINGNSKKQHKIYVLSHIRPNINLKKNYNQLNTKKKICQR